MLALSEKAMLIQALGQVINDEVTAAMKPILAKVDAFERVIGDLYIGKNSDMQEWVRGYVGDAIATLPKPEKGEPGAPGKDGANGKDADAEAILQQVMSKADAAVDEFLAGIPMPKDGRDGIDGKDGKDGKDGRDGVDGANLSLDDVRDCLSELVAKAIGDIPRPRNCVGGFIDRGGHLFLTFSDGSNSDLGDVVGRDGKDCDLELVRAQVSAFLATIEKPKDGRDGVGFDDLQVAYDGERLVEFKFIKGENAKVFNIVFPIPLWRGIWRQKEYSTADIVQRDGGMWITSKDTQTEPGSPNSDWKLCTKRGAEGPQGKPGRNGRDLTQAE